MRNLVTLVLALCWPALAVADELVLHTFSYHNHAEHSNPNNVNLGIGYSRDDGWAAGIYYNTYRNPSAYIAKDFSVKPNLGVFAGVATGYDQVSSYPLTLVGGLRFTFPLTDRTSLKLLVAPGVFGSQTIAHLTLTYKL